MNTLDTRPPFETFKNKDLGSKLEGFAGRRDVTVGEEGAAPEQSTTFKLYEEKNVKGTKFEELFSLRKRKYKVSRSPKSYI